jgi:hypothetical protein
MTPGVLGYGVVRGADPAAFARNGPSLFADPVAWLVCGAVESAIEECQQDLAGSRDHVGIIAISEFATLDTMRSIAATAGNGRVSPLRFAGSNPGALAGVSCISRGFRGPALTLSMCPADGVEPAVAIASGLLASGSASHLVLAAHAAAVEHVARCVIVSEAVDPRGWLEVRRLLTAKG